ncbi:unnamed protein product [Nesidiocoris tenuis]|uniref:Uncharacterized protein n=1 Tax=Nesidiocoris tenuis TaxID=355587 RepID=A0A6H5HSV4_9HEMI|nr:unnamed protein product [Nesidiocoris tenuis]
MEARKSYGSPFFPETKVSFGLSQDQPVWEITGAELTKNVVHTADGISVRFPRVTRIRDDKDWSTATSLAELKFRALYWDIGDH